MASTDDHYGQPLATNQEPATPDEQVFGSKHKTVIDASWQRCKDYGLTQSTDPMRGVLPGSSLNALLDEHQLLLNTTQKEVLPYYDHILANSKCMIVLADGKGHVLNTWGDRLFNERHQHGLVIGNKWSEDLNGTNAIGTAIACGQAVQVGREEHFLRANRFMVGSAAPIFNSDKEMVGVLDISSDAYLPQDHTLGMVKLMTLTVENRLIYNAFAREHLLITFNTNVASLTSPWSGLLALDDRGRIISANRRAEIILASDLALVNIENIFDCKLRELRHQPEGLPIELYAFGKFHMHLLVHSPKTVSLVAPDYRQQADTPTVKTDEQVELPDDVVPIDELEHGDFRLARMIKQASRIMEKDIPILLNGETGCGKEVFVRSLHFHSSRYTNALVAVNCAAIPSELVESELFGYEKGAFTGASNKGSIGLIRKAHRGTLFLDEIGEMPLQAQARLLRVLQERKVTPLGSTETWPVDIKLVSATNKHLKSEVNEGRFRGDLYYRISGLNLEMPALRDRVDKIALIEYVHKRLLNKSGEKFSPLPEAILEKLALHPWPGNVRQLISVLSIAIAMADGSPIDDWHLPDDFYEELNGVLSADVNQHAKRQVPDLGVSAHQNRAFQEGGAFQSGDSEQEIGSISQDVYKHQQANYSQQSSIHHAQESPVNYSGKSTVGERIKRFYQEFDGNISRTAKAAGVSRNTVYKYIRGQ